MSTCSRIAARSAKTLIIGFGFLVGVPALAQTSAEGDSLAPQIVKDTWTIPQRVVPADVGQVRDATREFFPAFGEPDGDGPRDVIYTPNGSEVWIVHRDTDNVSVFDANTRQYLATIAVGDFPTSIAMTPDGSKAVVTNVLDNSVSIIDVATHTVTDTVAVTGEQPFGVQIKTNATALVGVINDGVASAFSVIDLATATETNSIASSGQGVIGFWFTPETGGGGNIFSKFAMTPDGATIVLPDAANSEVKLYDVTTGVETAIPVAASPRGVDIAADGSFAAISHEGSTRIVSKIDLVSQSLVSESFTTGNLSNQTIRITPDNNFAIVGSGNDVLFVDLNNGIVTAVIATGSPGDIEISFDGQFAFVSNFNARVIDIATQSLVRTITFAACVEAAVSPTALQAVALNSRFRENIHFYNINGASGSLEGFASTGAPPEADSTTTADITPDGSLIVAGNLVSGNVSIIERATGNLRAVVDVGDRIKELRITPDGNYAVVCAMDGNAVGIIDLSTDTLVQSLPIFNRPARVRISPDGQYAYVLNVAGTDRISFIRVDGANSFIDSQVSAGQTGAANGPTFTETSGIELSPDGSILAVCDSFNDLVRLYDTTTQMEVAALPTGDFPLRVQFSANGSTAYVVNHFSDDVTAVRVNGAGSFVLGTAIGVGRFPLMVEVDPTGDFVYVGTRSSGGSGANAIRVIDVNTFSVVATIGLGDASPRDSKLSADEGLLYVLLTDGTLATVSMAGAGSAVQEIIPLTGAGRDVAYNVATRIAVVPQVVADGVDVLDFGGGIVGDIDGDGVVGAADLNLLLTGFNLCDGDPGFDAALDLSGDGCVGAPDLNLLLTNWS